MKINQFPGIYVIGRKDSLWTNYKRMMQTFGEEHFDFLPKTYNLPEDRDDLKNVMGDGRVWIVKPPNWFCGIGIKLINSMNGIPVRNGRNSEKRSASQCVQVHLLHNKLDSQWKVAVISEIAEK